MSENKGISLRRKKTTATRPTISSPIAHSSENGNGNANRNLSSLEPPVTTTASRSNSGWTPDAATNAAWERAKQGGGGDHTSDLVKRRYSTRFMGALPHDGSVPPIPAMPTIPAHFAASASAVGGMTAASRLSISGVRAARLSIDKERGKGRVKIDMLALNDPQLQAEKYVQSILADATEQDIHAYQKDLQHLKMQSDAELQNDVYQNRTQFIKISQEADKLKTEMRTLRTLMGELTSALGHATSAGGADLNAASTLSLADRKRANRSSVANLEALWSTHLQTLWKRVEGSQKYLPALPGRHIIMESQRWVELNAATWKPRRRVALVLLNDYLLVASEKKRPVENTTQNKRMSMYHPAGNSQSATTLVADRCWALHDVSLADISTRASSSVGHNHAKENKAIANAVNVRAGNESFTYATSDSGDKLNLIVAFRKAQEDQRKLLSQEHSKREQVIEELAMFSGRDPRLLKKAAASAGGDSAKGFGSLGRSNSVMIDSDGRPQSIRWVESQLDGLDIDIALQHFDDAVTRVEKLRKMARSIVGNQIAQDIILAKVNERASKLARSIARQLHHASSGMNSTKEKVSWLLRLGFEELARTTYLNSRTETIRIRTRQLPFTGSFPAHVHALAFTAFTLLLHTFRSFNQSFPSTSGSAVVRWAKERVDEFNESLERHLSNVARDGPVRQQCVETVKEQAKVLSEVGVDFGGLIARDLDLRGGDVEGKASSAVDA